MWYPDAQGGTIQLVATPTVKLMVQVIVQVLARVRHKMPRPRIGAELTIWSLPARAVHLDSHIGDEILESPQAAVQISAHRNF
jgi:hypothetical protein